ncbi:MAG: IPT/TIG domain-containing protein, partial [Planctomycetes bacterium]|nr:IPT/TIG domain-containing protein [Planctomycetota bacterium]
RTLKGRRLKLDGSGIAFVGNVFDIAPARPQISTQSASFGDNGSLSAFLVTWWDSSENILWGQMVLPSLQASAVMPNSGAAAGGDSVQLDGHGFTQSATVTIDGNPLGSPFVPPDGTTFSGITPAGTLGSWDVFIDNGDGQTWTITSGFTYTNDKIFNGTQVNGFWSDAANWSPAGVPVSTDSVFFPSGVPFAPVFDLASAQVVNVTIGSGAVLNFMASPRTLSVSGNWTNDGSLSAMPSATVDFNGSGVQLVNGVTMFPTVSITGGGTVKIEPGGVMWAPGYTQASCCTVMVLGGGELAIQTGTIDGMVDVWAGGILEYFSSLTVNATGTVNLNPGSQLLGDNTASMMVLGTFQSAGALVSSLSPGTKRYTLTLDGVVDVVGTSFDSPESSGLIISSTAAIAGFSGNSFTGAVSGGTHLRVEQVGPFSMTAPGCTFDDSFGPGIGSNVTAEDFSAPANVTVAFPSSSGVGAGESYDNEIGGAVISWNAAPQIWDIYPEFGPTGGGTVVTITGYDFDPGSTVYFGASPASSTSVLSPYEIQAVSPSGSSGEVDLFVYNPDNQSDMTHFVYSTSTSVQIGVSGGSTANDYRMYSVPAFMTGSQIIDAMESQLGPYDSTQWRCYRHESDWGYMEWPSFWDQPDSDPMGRAIWIISRNPVSLNFSGYSTGVVSEFTVDLEIGWNQIGTPYNSAVAWSSVLAQDVDPVTHDFVGSPEPVTSSSLVGSTLYAYDGNGYVASSSLAPGAGYWVYNAAGHNISLRVPSPGGATKPSSAPIYSGLSAATPLPPPPPGGTVAGASGVSAPSASLPAARASDTGGAASSSSGVGAASGGGGGGGGGCFAGSASAGSIAGMAASLSAVMVALLLFQLTVFARRLPGNR